MPLRIYIAPQIGDGTMPSLNPSDWTDATGPRRSKVHKYLSNSDMCSNINHTSRLVFLSVVDAPSATLDAIEADSQITAVIPIRATDWGHLSQIMSAPFSSYPLAWRNAARTFLENNGVNTEWITGSHTMKDVLRQVVKLFSVSQVADGQGQAYVKTFLTQGLDTTVGNIPAAQRNAVGAWMQSKGIDTSWITGTTTIRQIVHALAPNFGKLYGRDVLHHFAGEDF